MTDEKFDLCGYCCAWVHDHDGKSPASVCSDYPELMRKVLKHRFGIGGKASGRFIKDACYGNWLKLHETDMERRADSAEYADALLGDVFYASDRWSWDRVLRIQWLYQRLRERVRRESNDEEGL